MQVPGIYFLKKDPLTHRLYFIIPPGEGNGDINPDDLLTFTSNRITGCPSGTVNGLIPLPLNSLENGINIQTKGTGALTRGQGGSCRGNYSVDLQGSRQVNNQVAHGDHSIILGGRFNRAEEEFSSVGGGIRNIAAGPYSSIVGGIDTSISSSHACIGGGIGQEVSGARAGTLGGFHLRVLGSDCTAVGRYNNHNVSIDRLFSVGDGLSEAGRRNAFSVSREGNAYAGMNFVTTGADMGEFFVLQSSTKRALELRSTSKEDIPIGSSVVLEEGAVRRAREGETPLGIISNTCSYIGNSNDENEGKVLVGLLGQVKVLIGEPTSPEWIYMGPHDLKGYNLWFIR